MGQTEKDAGQTKHAGGRPAMFETVEDLEAKIEEYFDLSEPKPVTTEDEDGKIVAVADKYGNAVMTQVAPTIAGLAYFLGFSDRRSVYDLKDRKEFSHTIKRATLRIERFHEQSLSLRDKPTGSIFWLKNHEWSDKQEIEHSGSVRVVASEVDERL
jgi:hypothetical protein